VVRPMQIFLGHGFDKYKVNAHGNPDESGISNYDIGLWFKREIERIGGSNAVHVVTTEDPMTALISEEVKRQIDASDAVFCLFCKRVRDPYNDWTTSQYVMSESGYATCRFRHDTEKRLFGFIEAGVDRRNLGLAFPGDRTVHLFNRDNLPAILPVLEKAVRDVLRHSSSVSSDDPEPLLLHKKIQIRRDGRAKIETFYRFRVRKSSKQFRMHHSIWRVRESLPDFGKMLEARPSDAADFFRCVPWQCGKADVSKIDVEFQDIQKAAHKKEVCFTIRFPNVSLEPGDLVEYQVAYSYDRAFFASQDLENWEKNSTGLMTRGRGPVGQAILTVMFERNWNKSVCTPAIELEDGHGGPTLAIASQTNLPAAGDPRVFWHQLDGWIQAGSLEPVKDTHHPLFEVYEWRRENFNGLAKATWQPSFNYHQPQPKKTPTGKIIPTNK